MGALRMTGDGRWVTDEQYWIVQEWKLVALIINVAEINPSLEGFIILFRSS